MAKQRDTQLIDQSPLDLWKEDEDLSRRAYEAYDIDRSWRDEWKDYDHITYVYERTKHSPLIGDDDMPRFNMMRQMVSDLLGVILLNHDHEYGAETFVPHPARDVTVSPDLPEWLRNGKALLIGSDAVRALPFDGKRLHVGTLSTASLVCITWDAGVEAAIHMRYRQLRQRLDGGGNGG